MSARRATPAGGRSPSTSRVIVGIVALVVVVGLVGTLIGGWWLFGRDADVEAPGSSVAVEIPKGASTTEIGRILDESGLIDSQLSFRVAVERVGADGKLRAGTYELVTGMPDDAIVDALLAGPEVAYVTVTIPEGFTVGQVAGRLAEETGLEEGELVELVTSGAAVFAPEHPYLADTHQGSLEGFLFPKTYRVREGSTATQTVELLLDQFDKEISNVDLSASEARGQSLYELVTVASMIERETKVADERPLVASVIYNRLEEGMRLGIDATIEYVLPGNRLRLSAEDLEIDSPYNTYRNSGLPAGPIGNPGAAALEAAARPEDTSYLYYVLTGEDGSHTFTETYEEFLVAKQKSKEVFGE
jgi:UPF0755 protein